MMADRLKLDDFLPYRLSFTFNLVSERIAGIYEALFGLSISEWRLIAVLAEADAITQAGVGLRTRMDKVTVSRAALSLACRGLMDGAPMRTMAARASFTSPPPAARSTMPSRQGRWR